MTPRPPQLSLALAAASNKEAACNQVLEEHLQRQSVEGLVHYELAKRGAGQDGGGDGENQNGCFEGN